MSDVSKLRNTDTEVEAQVCLGTRSFKCACFDQVSISMQVSAFDSTPIEENIQKISICYSKFNYGKFTVTTCIYLLAEVFIKDMNVSAANLERNSVPLS